jgi:hypothetical protein
MAKPPWLQICQRYEQEDKQEQRIVRLPQILRHQLPFRKPVINDHLCHLRWLMEAQRSM